LSKNDKSTTQTQDPFAGLLRIGFVLGQPLIEIFYGIRKDTITYFPAITWGLAFDFIVLSELDQKFFRYLKIGFLYPTNPITYTVYCFGGVFFGFWLWGLVQTMRRMSAIQRLTEVFLESGLKSPMGKLPNFIFDRPVDEFVRRLRLTNAFLPKAKFEEAKDKLEAALQVYIDEISENRISGTIDLLYSHYEISKQVQYSEVSGVSHEQFFVGQTRARQVIGSLIETPHLLIGGQTGGGKSTFLRQLITTLYLKNRDYRFSLIDMKGGLEFQLFENRERVRVLSNASDAKDTLARLALILEQRFKVLKHCQCKDLEAYSELPKEKKKLPADVPEEVLPLTRHIIVIDEAAELFLAGSKTKSAEVQEMVRHVIRIAAQGRAVGIHLMIATQKPDVNAINGQIKANLTGVLSFPMATLGASMSILGSGRAKELPSIAGRAVWKAGLDTNEVQTPYMSPEEAKTLLDKVSPQKNGEA